MHQWTVERAMANGGKPVKLWDQSLKFVASCLIIHRKKRASLCQPRIIRTGHLAPSVCREERGLHGRARRVGTWGFLRICYR